MFQCKLYLEYILKAQKITELHLLVFLLTSTKYTVIYLSSKTKPLSSINEPSLSSVNFHQFRFDLLYDLCCIAIQAKFGK